MEFLWDQEICVKDGISIFQEFKGFIPNSSILFPIQINVSIVKVLLIYYSSIN